MKTVLSSRKRDYVKRACIFLIVIAFVAVIVSCNGAYNLTMAVDPAGSGTATDLTGASPYAQGTEVSIKAEAAACYRFAGWTASAGTVADPNAEETTFIMPDQDATVTANFEPLPLDHFKCYEAWDTAGLPIDEVVYLEDQFGAVEATVEWANLFCNPVAKRHEGVMTPIADPDHHLTVYNLTYEEEPQEWFVEVDNQFGTQNLTVSGPVALAVPTQKEGHEPPVCLDHFLLYEVTAGPPLDVVVDLGDQFGSASGVSVYEPVFFANPVQKTHGYNVTTEIENPEAHLVFYEISPPATFPTPPIQVVNQFGEQTLKLEWLGPLAVPSEKIDWHARCKLTIDSTTGGSVTVPGEGTFTYDCGTVVDLVAEADDCHDCYEFVSWTGDVGTISDVNDATTVITVDDNYSITANFFGAMVTAGRGHTVGVKSDGTVVAVGANLDGQCNVASWTDIDQSAAGGYHTVGLKSDGTVVAAGNNAEGECDVSGWTGITQVSAGSDHTVGLKSDGTVIAVGWNSAGQCDVASWTDITQVAAGYYHTVGVKSDGTVVAVGDNYYGQCNVGNWTGIIQVAASYGHTVGVKSDGTVVAVGHNEQGQCDVSGWVNIAQVAAGFLHTVGLKSDDTVFAVGYNYFGQCNVGGWTDICQVAAGMYHTVGVKSDGTVVAVGNNDDGQCSVGGWDLIS